MSSRAAFWLQQGRLFPSGRGFFVKLGGRTNSLGIYRQEALEFVRKNTLNERPLLWIDDLELWWSPAIPLNQNVRAKAFLF